MKTLITAMMVCTLSADVDSVNVASPEYVIENHPTYIASADVKKKKKKGFFSKGFGSK